VVTETDNLVAAYMKDCKEYVFSYVDDSNETIDVTNDDELKAAYDDGLEAQGAILKIYVHLQGQQP